MTDSAQLLSMAAQLRDAAAQANRPDVVAKVDDVILLLADAQPATEESKGNVVLRILDGLGF
ncbi:hypothetical protein KOI35_37120 [Actinoplanes bogorensis]|uniref:Uncharacterized protein n=1 Tax=Paractinoplanes bogorensis TaxID=1610840 RepID=A0ABS5Z414_9ACTN|nr:hypothetical protein [Actinoplanes bogorensis]MBU2669150.1 hypothetical protein [Actinoplanes bogorensis]